MDFFYHAGDVFFYLLHIAIILFNLFGWVWRRTLRFHLVVILLTAASWFVLGIWYGFGYCFITDWHWQIKRHLGETDLPASFITYFFHSINLPISSGTADALALSGFTIALIASIFRNTTLSRKGNKSSSSCRKIKS